MNTLKHNIAARVIALLTIAFALAAYGFLIEPK